MTFEDFERPLGRVWEALTSRPLTPATAFRMWRVLCEQDGRDAYAEPPFERVWVRAEQRGRGFSYGLEFAGRTIEGWVSEQVLRDPELAVSGRRILLEDLAEIVLDEERHHHHAMTRRA